MCRKRHRHCNIADKKKIFTGRNTTSQKAHLVQVCTRMNLRGRNLRDDGIFGESGTTHEMVDGFAILGQAACAVRHQTLTLSKILIFH